MVNKCSVTGCKSLYVKDNVKLHRFPLTNAETLPLWVTATGREKDWKPCKSSRLCGNHFRESEYIVGHGKGVLKSTAIPTIEYRVNIPRYTKKKYQHLYDDLENTNKLYDIEPMQLQENDSNVEIVQLDYNDIYESKYQYQNKNNNHNEPHQTNEFQIKNIIEEESTKDNTYNNDNKDAIIKPESTQTKEMKMNRENQCYMFTSTFQEETISVLTPPESKPYEGSSSMNIDQLKANSSFNKIMSLKLRRQRRTKDIYSLYFESLTKENVLKSETNEKSFNDDTDTFGAFIVTQLKELRPYKKLYLTTKHQIQKILMKAQLKIAN